MIDSVYPKSFIGDLEKGIYREALIRDFFNNFIRIAIDNENFVPYYHQLPSDILNDEQQIFRAMLVYERAYESVFSEKPAEDKKRKCCIEQAYLYTPISLYILQKYFKTLLGQFAFLDEKGEFDQERASSVGLPIIFDPENVGNQQISLMGLYKTLLRANRFPIKKDKTHKVFTDDDVLAIRLFLSEVSQQNKEINKTDCGLARAIDKEILQPFFDKIGCNLDQVTKSTGKDDSNNVFLSFIKNSLSDASFKTPLSKTVLILHTLFKYGLSHIKRIMLNLDASPAIFREEYFRMNKNESAPSEFEKQLGIYLLEEGEIVLGLMLDHVYRDGSNYKCVPKLLQVLEALGFIDGDKCLIDIGNIIMWLKRSLGISPYEADFKINFRPIFSKMFRFKPDLEQSCLAKLKKAIEEADLTGSITFPFNRSIEAIFDVIFNREVYQEGQLRLRFLKEWKHFFALFSYNEKISRAELSFRFLSDIIASDREFQCYYFTDIDGKTLLLRHQLEDYKSAVSDIFNKYASISTYLGISSVRNRIESDFEEKGKIIATSKITGAMSHTIKQYAVMIQSILEAKSVNKEGDDSAVNLSRELYTIVKTLLLVQGGDISWQKHKELLSIKSVIETLQRINLNTIRYGKLSKGIFEKTGEDPADINIYFLKEDYSIPINCSVEDLKKFVKINPNLFRIFFDEIILNLFRHTATDWPAAMLNAFKLIKIDVFLHKMDSEEKLVIKVFSSTNKGNIENLYADFEYAKKGHIKSLTNRLAQGLYLNHELAKIMGWEFLSPEDPRIEDGDFCYFVQEIHIPTWEGFSE